MKNPKLFEQVDNELKTQQIDLEPRFQCRQSPVSRKASGGCWWGSVSWSEGSAGYRAILNIGKYNQFFPCPYEDYIPTNTFLKKSIAQGQDGEAGTSLMGDWTGGFSFL